MKPRRTHASNHVFRLSGGNEDNDLWVEVKQAAPDDLVNGDPMVGAPMLRSVWEFDEDERREIAEGANVRLTIFSIAQPPVSLAVVDEPLGKPPTEAA